LTAQIPLSRAARRHSLPRRQSRTANGYTIVNLAGSYDLGNGLSAYARIDNLFDRHYQDPIGFLRPGLGIFAGMRMAFDVVPPSR
jgi:outer membrane cobalamin receptor